MSAREVGRVSLSFYEEFSNLWVVYVSGHKAATLDIDVLSARKSTKNDVICAETFKHCIVEFLKRFERNILLLLRGVTTIQEATPPAGKTSFMVDVTMIEKEDMRQVHILNEHHSNTSCYLKIDGEEYLVGWGYPSGETQLLYRMLNKEKYATERTILVLTKLIFEAYDKYMEGAQK